jgi:hypothetical protein
MLTCACGARFEIDDSFAGQEVSCPECQQPVKVPPRQKAAPRTSGYALASVVVALVGAFTAATPLAVGLGVAALVSIRRHRERLTGTGFAIFGIVLGCIFGVLTLLGLSTYELFGLGGHLRERMLAGEVDTSGPLEVVVADRGFAITRPSEKWGQVRAGHLVDDAIGGLQLRRDLLLMQVARYCFVDVRVEAANGQGLDRWQDDVLAEFQPKPRQPFRFPAEDDDEDDVLRTHTRAELKGSRRLPTADGVEGREMTVDVRRAGQHWRFIIRLYRKGNGPVYVVRAYTQARRLSLVERELNQALDSFRILR